MPSSGVYSWPMTARDLITQALREGGVYGGGEDPSADDLSDCLVRLNGLQKSWDVGLWREADVTVTATADISTITLGSSVKDVVGVRVVEPSYERPLARWERDDYQTNPIKAQSGTPTAYYFSRRAGAPILYLWPVPTVDTVLKLDTIRHAETITDPSETVDFPEEYQETLFTNLAVRCAGIFDVEPKAELVARAQWLEMKMLDAERPESYFLGPAIYG